MERQTSRTPPGREEGCQEATERGEETGAVADKEEREGGDTD